MAKKKMRGARAAGAVRTEAPAGAHAMAPAATQGPSADDVAALYGARSALADLKSRVASERRSAELKSIVSEARALNGTTALDAARVVDAEGRAATEEKAWDQRVAAVDSAGQRIDAGIALAKESNPEPVKEYLRKQINVQMGREEAERTKSDRSKALQDELEALEAASKSAKRAGGKARKAAARKGAGKKKGAGRKKGAAQKARAGGFRAAVAP